MGCVLIKCMLLVAAVNRYKGVREVCQAWKSCRIPCVLWSWKCITGNHHPNKRGLRGCVCRLLSYPRHTSTSWRPCLWNVPKLDLKSSSLPACKLRWQIVIKWSGNVSHNFWQLNMIKGKELARRPVKKELTDNQLKCAGTLNWFRLDSCLVMQKQCCMWDARFPILSLSKASDMPGLKVSTHDLHASSSSSSPVMNNSLLRHIALVIAPKRITDFPLSQTCMDTKVLNISVGHMVRKAFHSRACGTDLQCDCKG